MPDLVIYRGLPASGKTTLAQAWVSESPATRARVNRDDLRAMAHQSVYLGQDTERQIQSVRDAAITSLLKRNISTVSDDTNLPQRTARDLARIGRLHGADVSVIDLTAVPLDTCIARDQARESSVGEGVIRGMHERYLAGKRSPLPLPEDEPEVGVGRPYVARPDTPRAVMVDIDGTCALMGTRSPFDETRVHEDTPNLPVVAAIRAHAAVGAQVIFCSGRTDACRQATELWLQKHVIVRYEALFMRRAGDTRNDAIVKLELFDRYIRDQYDVTFVLDDRRRVVDAWRSIGLTVFQVAPGEF